MRELGKIFSFSAAHRLPSHKGLCRRLHGHTYKLEVRVSGEPITSQICPDWGMIIDFTELKNIVKEVVLDSHDHVYLNDIYPNPTAEVMVYAIAKAIHEKLPVRVHLKMVKLWETETSYAIWKTTENL
jgi:6-pyruvoyltetrahydropterin/6-carboxytetrahydropterin synthase